VTFQKAVSSWSAAVSALDIAGMAAILAVSLIVTVKETSAAVTLELLCGFPPLYRPMLVPPCPAAGFGAENLSFAVWTLPQSFTAISAMVRAMR
jgi:uncharacterized membrane protein